MAECGFAGPVIKASFVRVSDCHDEDCSFGIEPYSTAATAPFTLMHCPVSTAPGLTSAWVGWRFGQASHSACSLVGDTCKGRSCLCYCC